MGLSIQRLNIDVRTPRSHEVVVGSAISSLGDRLRSEIGPHLGPSLDRGSDIVQIRELKLSLHLTAEDLAKGRLIDRWLQAFSHRLFQTLALPSEPDAWGVFRESSRAILKARFLDALLRGGQVRTWYFREFAPAISLTRGDAVVELLTNEPREMLLALDAVGALEGALSVLSEVHLESLVRSVSPPAKVRLEISSLIRSLQFAIQSKIPTGWRIDGRRAGLLLYTKALQRAHSGDPATIIGHLALARAIRQRDPLHGVEDDLPQAGGWWKEIAQAATPWELAQLGELAAAVFPSEMPQASVANWLRSRYAGILLTLPLVEQEAWWKLREDSRFKDPAFSCLLAAVALELCDAGGKEDLLADPAVYAFAGAKEPISRSVWRSIASLPDWDRAAALLGIPAGGFDQLASRLAERLATRFGQRIRGFRSLSPQGVRRLFLQCPGRIALLEKQLSVELDPSSHHIALHLAGADTPFETSAWFGSRRLSFRLEGL